jgi:nucleoside-diphosphate-sugar epimerase
LPADPTDQRILVTGAAGFIGTALCDAFSGSGRDVRRAVRQAEKPSSGIIAVGDIGPDTQWQRALEGIECVIHLAARAHIMQERFPGALDAYRTVNVAGTEKLARDAAAAGVRRLVFLSSVKVNGESTRGRPFSESDAPQPEDGYGVSKWEAEQVVRKVAADSGLEAVVLRAPLVYGPRVKGNFLRLMHMVARGWPLSLASVLNKRSFVYVGNLVDALITAAQSPAAAGRTYLVSDGEDMSTPELIRGIAKALGVPSRLFPVPVTLLRAGGTLLGHGDALARLTGSLQVDSSRIRRELGWIPPFSVAQGLQETGRWYLKAMSGER